MGPMLVLVALVVMGGLRAETLTGGCGRATRIGLLGRVDCAVGRAEALRVKVSAVGARMTDLGRALIRCAGSSGAKLYAVGLRLERSAMDIGRANVPGILARESAGTAFSQ
jgi:hypothetical protein